MNISGVLVHIRPEQVDAVKSRLSEISGVEIHATTDDGRLVVTIENDDGPMIDTMNSFHDIAGVLSASLIYHHFDEEIEQ
ncbi:chaperone NapD [Kaarinaea lacus]